MNLSISQVFLKLVWVILFPGNVQAICPSNVFASFPFVLEYALWRGWHQAVIYTPNIEPGCQWATVRLVKCLGLNGVAMALNSTTTGAKGHGRLGIIILSPKLRYNATEPLENIIKELHKLQMDTASYDWLITARSDQDVRYVNKVLNGTTVRFDQNIVVAFWNHKYRPKTMLRVCEINFIYKVNNQNTPRMRSKCFDGKAYDPTCLRELRDYPQKIDYGSTYYRSTERFKNLSNNNTYKSNRQVRPLRNSGITDYNYSRNFDMLNVTKFHLTPEFRRWAEENKFDQNSKRIQIHVVQYFKVRINSTLYAKYLGIWYEEESMSFIEIPYPVEARNFLGEEMIVGRCNSSGEGAPTLDDDGPSAPASLDDVLHFFTIRLNTSSSSRYYSKLGFRTYEGTWTGLLGALVENSVDIALEPVTAHASRHRDMDFIFPIAETMCNIYIRQQETSTVRDIFLAPFSARLVACVVAVALVAALAIVLISRLAPAVHHEPRSMGYTEAIIWSTGILCQQGGSWTPPSTAASVLLIVCLLFAVVTYNAYAAFITSVLSVRVASVDTVAAVLKSPDFKIGYIRNGADQNYLMSTKDAQLNAFYIRGYSNAENLVSSAEEGLARAASQDYAFFAGQRAARTTLRSLSQARGRCAVREVPVHSTRAQLAFPLPRNSPYARPTLLSLLQLRSGGSLARLEAALVPEMPHCAPPIGFASARATDVRSALLLLVVGYIVAILIGVAEYCWKNRGEIRNFFSRLCTGVFNIFK